MIDFSSPSLASIVHPYQQTSKACNPWGFSTSGCALEPVQSDKAMTNSMGVNVNMVKKFTYFILGLFVILILGSAFSGALEFNNVISSGIQRVGSFPESGWLVVLGALLISGATFLRRRRAARSR
ncbi:MAG TPA: LPXTG cell wall anchor domain-containing protein [Candidatus Angelobacter sp.]|nr:LPXTG cell wall anchor domain-containing protein [Candidatus Angelobacter sp.]